METKVLNYRIIITPEKHQGKTVYNAYCPTLGISDFGKTVDLAKKNVHGAIECHIEGLIKTGFEVPSPDTQEFYLSQTEIIAPKGIRFAF